MSNIQACEHCHYDFLIEQDYCPHCGCPGLFPNVQRSNTSNEIQALENRYQSSRRDGKRRGCLGKFEVFEDAIQHSMAVINRSLNDFERIVKSDNKL
ncbi:hypothetical protein GF373_14535 [bacterium]|nr:hypothetical protein [bacterium]